MTEYMIGIRPSDNRGDRKSEAGYYTAEVVGGRLKGHGNTMPEALENLMLVASEMGLQQDFDEVKL